MIQQRTAAWYEARRGKPTGSQFARIFKSNLQPSKSREGYMNELLLEKLGRGVKKFFENTSMKIGVAREPNGVAMFELMTGIETFEAPFMQSSCKNYGASPDRIWHTGVLELKCPMLKTHLEYSKKGKASLTPTKYRLQLRSQMLIADVPFGYFCSYHPDAAPLIIKEERDNEWDTEFKKGMASFLSELEAKYKRACRNLLEN